MLNKIIKQGDIYYVDLGSNKGSIQSGYRPIVIYQNDVGNRFSPIVNAYCITKASNHKANIPTHVYIGTDSGLKEKSIILIEQPVTINKFELERYIGRCNKKILKEIWKAVSIQHGKIKPKCDLSYIYDKIRKIQNINSFINKYKYRGYDFNEELLDKSILLSEIVIYCKNYNIDYEKLLIQNNILNKKRIQLAI